ncbi:MAG: DNA-binding protein [Methanobacteriota archaeon]
MDDELEALRKKRLQQLQQQQFLSQDSFDEQADQQKEQDKQRQQILRAILTTKARERLGNIKVARPEIAENIENQLIMLAQNGRLQSKINDEQLRELLSRILPRKKDITIRRR